MLILMCDRFGPELPGRLAELGDVTDDMDRLAEAEVALVRSKTKVTAEFLDGAPQLRLVIRGGVGLDNVDCEHAAKRGIGVYNTAEASTIAVAELAFSMMIALPNHTVQAHTSTKAGQWLKKELQRTELYEKTLAILGYGRIGEALAIRARAFGMRVVGWRRSPSGDETAAMVTTAEEAVSGAHYVSIHLPCTDATRGLMDDEFLGRLREGAYLVNTGRGECVDEEAVVRALESGRLAGYATDVWRSEPPEGSPLLGAPNTLFAPHIGASTSENLTRIGAVIESLLRAYASGDLDGNGTTT